MRLAIFGIGGCGRELLLPARQQLGSGGIPRYKEIVFVDDKPSGPVLGVSVLSLDGLGEGDEYVIGVGSSEIRRSIADRCSHLATGAIRAPSAVIGPDVEIGEGAVFCEFTMATTSVRIGRHFQCNTYASVAHDCVIGDFVTFAPRVCCNGNVHIADDVYVGTGAVIRQGLPDEPLTIGRGAVIGMGAVVTKSVPAGATVVGNPARPLER